MAFQWNKLKKRIDFPLFFAHCSLIVFHPGGYIPVTNPTKWHHSHPHPLAVQPR